MKQSACLTLLWFSSLTLWGGGNDIFSSLANAFGTDPDAGKSGFLSLTIPSGGKYEGMGTAHTAVALDGSFFDGNPAGIALLSNSMLSVSHVNWISDSSLETISFNIRPDKIYNFGWGGGIKFLHLPFTGYDSKGGFSDGGGTAASGWYTELTASATAAYNILRSFHFGGISIGGSLKAGYRGISESIQKNQSAVSLIGDFGVMSRFNFLKGYASRDMNFSLGATLKNFGAEFIDNPDPLPAYISVGFSFKPIEPLLLAADLNIPFSLKEGTSKKIGFAFGINADVTPFLSLHSGIRYSPGAPRLTIGSTINLGKIMVDANYTLDPATRLDVFDRLSITVKMNFKPSPLAAVRDEVQNLYAEGLDAYNRGYYERAITLFEKSLSLDPEYTPAKRMMDVLKRYLEEQKKVRSGS